jgi:hypothetical protein
MTRWAYLSREGKAGSVWADTRAEALKIARAKTGEEKTVVRKESEHAPSN